MSNAVPKPPKFTDRSTPILPEQLSDINFFWEGVRYDLDDAQTFYSTIFPLAINVLSTFFLNISHGLWPQMPFLVRA